MKPLAQNTLIQNRYLIVHLIGKGGMGEVYLAVDQRLGSAVALKRTFFAGDDMLGNAFEREARTLARMRHPVLPKVSDHFGENDEQYLVMEHISGDDLSKRLDAAGKPFPVSWVLFWADQLLDALSYLHTNEPPIIHRDIKPQNLKLTDENHIILLDFGLSKTSTGQTNISQSGSTGSVVGYTPHYAPMEQIRGIGTSPRSDLYSLSATLYQLLTNTVPVDALSRADAMLNELPDPIRPPHELNPEIPKSVSDILLRGMEVSQEKRYANAREMQRVLRKAFNEIQQATTANTVAFSAKETDAVSVTPSASATLGGNSSQTADVPAVPDDASGRVVQEAQDDKAIKPESGIDLDATMAYEPEKPVTGGVRQADVKTEVFLAGSNSLASPGIETSEQSPAVSVGSSALESQDSGEKTDDSFVTPTQQAGVEPGVTVPFIAVDRADAGAEVASATVAGVPQEPEFFDNERPSEPPAAETQFYRSSESEPEVRSAAGAYTADVPAARPAKKSSGKMIALFGGLAALLLLAIAVVGGVWAYVNYAPSFVESTPTPEPTAEETVEASPSPEPTIETNVNADIGNSNLGNTDANNSSTNDNSNRDIMVDPTPEPTPDRGTTLPGTRPTPRPAPTRPASTPGPKPTPNQRRTPVPRLTPLP